MNNALRRTDAWVAASSPGWLWAGQLALVVLGVHLAADRLDDHLFSALSLAPWGWPDPEVPARIAAWTAVALELAVAVRAAWVLLSSVGAGTVVEQRRVLEGRYVSEASYQDAVRLWWAKRSVESLVRPLFWGVMALSGAWVVWMAVEDLVASWWSPASMVAGALAGSLAAWRLGWTGFVHTVNGLFVPKRKTWGLVWAPPLLVVTALALADGLPIWGWS